MRIISTLIFVLVLTGCIRKTIQKSLTHEGFEFPDAEAVHPGNSLEWWYFTGHLYDSLQHEYGVEFVFFHFNIRNRTYLMSNVAVSNGEDKEFIYAYEFDRAKNVPTGLPINLSMPHEQLIWKMTGQQGNYQLTADTYQGGLYGFRLKTETNDDPWIHDEDGYEDYGSYASAGYYTYPRLQTDGILMWDGDMIEVEGELWYDRQWDCLTVMKDKVRWDWFGIQLDNGDNIMLYIVKHVDGKFEIKGGGIQKGDQEIELTQDDLTFTESEYWTSEATSRKYPTRWDIEIPSHGYKLTLSTPIPEQELQIKLNALAKINYWEGMCEVSGSHTGDAYIEMTNR